MKIRTRLALQFALIVGIILLLFSFSVYYFTSAERESEFYLRLKNKALTTAHLLLDVNEVDISLLSIIDENTINALYDEKIAVYDNTNKRLYLHEETPPSILVSSDILNKVRHEKEYRYKMGEHEAVGLLFEHEGRQFVLVASAYDHQGLTQIGYLRAMLISGFITSVVIALISGWLFAQQMLKPISNVVSQVGRITASNLSLRVNAGSKKDEIAQLAYTFNRMLERLESAFEMQKRFVANASHELRTPLTAITGQIEVSLLKKRSLEEYEATLRSVFDDVRNLSKLTNGLLELAQAKTDSTELSMKPVRLDEILWQTREDLLRAHREYNININYKHLPEDENKLMIMGSEQLLKIAFANLLDNGCKFSDNCTIDVFLSVRDNIRIVFSDKGKGIPGEELGQIFQPFFRGSNVKHIPGHGLGLPLTEKIVHLYNGDISITSSPGKGTAISITFPVHSF